MAPTVAPPSLKADVLVRKQSNNGREPLAQVLLGNAINGDLLHRRRRIVQCLAEDRADLGTQGGGDRETAKNIHDMAANDVIGLDGKARRKQRGCLAA